MKKAVGLFLILILGINTFAQDKPAVSPEKNVIKVNTLALFVLTGSVFYEREISDLNSLQLGVAYLGYKISDTRFTGIILTPEVRFYVRKDALDGFYVAPYFRYQSFGYNNTESVETEKGSLTTYGGGVALGRQWIFAKGFVLDFFIGGHYSGSSIDITSGSEPTNIAKFEGFRTRVGLNLGFAF